MSDGDPPRLTVELLEELKERWRALGAPIAQQLRPGLSNAQIDAIVAPLGLDLPGEARVWWGWHDGASGRQQADQPFAGWWLCPLAEAVEQASWERNEAFGLAGERAESVLWKSSWLPMSTDIGGSHAAVDCARPADLTTPVYYVDREGGKDKFEPRAPTIGTMIRWWIDTIDEGICVYDKTAGRWRRDFQRLDPERALSRLV